MATDLKARVRGEIDRLRKELAVATGQVAALRDEIKKHELIYDVLDGPKTGKGPRQGRSGAGALKRGPRGAMIDWTAVFATLPNQFTLDSLLAHETGEREAAILPEAGSGAVVEGRPDQAHRPGHVRENLIPKKLDGTEGAAFQLARSHRLCIRTSPRPNREPLAGRQPFAFQWPVGYPWKPFPTLAAKDK